MAGSSSRPPPEACGSWGKLYPFLSSFEFDTDPIHSFSFCLLSVDRYCILRRDKLEMYKLPPLPPGCPSEYKKRAEEVRAYHRRRLRGRDGEREKEGGEEVRERPTVIPLHNVVDVRSEFRRWLQWDYMALPRILGRRRVRQKMFDPFVDDPFSLTSSSINICVVAIIERWGRHRSVRRRRKKAPSSSPSSLPLDSSFKRSAASKSNYHVTIFPTWTTFPQTLCSHCPPPPPPFPPPLPPLLSLLSCSLSPPIPFKWLALPLPCLFFCLLPLSLSTLP